MNSRSPVVIAYALLITTILALFWPLLTGHSYLAFRDAAHFYSPLYEYVANRQSQQWLPLWDPCDLVGMSLMGETTTALLYPPRLLVYRIVSNPAVALSWYVLLHLLLAAATAHGLAATAGAGPLGRALAILGYPFAGPVVFLIYNPPFLVSAAWLPLLLMSSLRLFATSELRWPGRWAAISAMTTAMMIAAGDPQSAFHAWLLIALYWLAQAIKAVRSPTPFPDARNTLLRGASGILCSVILAGCLIAPQLAASIDWASQSDRVAQRGTETLDYHTKLLHWLELCSPLVSGTWFPEHARVSRLLAADERDWCATLYGGVVVLALALQSVARRGPHTHGWLALAALGLLLAHPVCNQWLGQLLPGYQLFRYPAKWLPFASLGFVMLAASSCEHHWPGPYQAKRLLIGIMTVAVLASGWMIYEVAACDPGQVPADRVWGPFQARRAYWHVAVSLLQVTLALAAFAHCWQRGWTTGLLVVIAIDLAAAAYPQLILVDRATAQQAATAAIANVSPIDATADEEIPVVAPESQTRGVRTLASTAWPASWSTTAAPARRLRELYYSERASGFGRWHLAHGTCLFNAPVTIRPRRIDEFWTAMEEQDRELTPAERGDAWMKIYAWLGIDREWIVSPTTVSLDSTTSSSVMEVVKQKPVSPQPTLVQWHPQWRSLHAADERLDELMSQRLSELVSGSELAGRPLVEVPSSTRPIWLKDVSTRVEGSISDDPLDELKLSSSPQASVRLVGWTEEHQTYLVRTPRPGLLEWKMFQDGHWTATATRIAPDSTRGTAQPLALYRTDLLFMGAELDEGDWQIDFVYRPWWLGPSVLGAGVSWLIGVWLLVWSPAVWSPATWLSPTTTGRPSD